MIYLEYSIQLNNVGKVYRMGSERIIALNNITLNFEKGKVYCLIGKSGSGKSTLLNLIAGLEKPSKGSIIVNNERIDKMSEKKLALFRQKYIGFIFQSYNLLPTLTALENVTLPLIFKGVPKKKRMAAAMKMLKAVGLADRYKHRPMQMSGGQQQRVSIARAFVNNPPVIFADEPTGNLDTKTTIEMMDLMTGLSRQYRRTLVIVTHNLEISSYADQIIHIRDGVIEKIEDVAKISIPINEENASNLGNLGDIENDEKIQGDEHKREN